MRLWEWVVGRHGVSREAQHARLHAIRQEMDQHPANRGESVGRKESRLIGDRINYWRTKWAGRESGE